MIYGVRVYDKHNNLTKEYSAHEIQRARDSKLFKDIPLKYDQNVGQDIARQPKLKLMINCHFCGDDASSFNPGNFICRKLSCKSCYDAMPRAIKEFTRNEYKKRYYAKKTEDQAKELGGEDGVSENQELD